MTMLMLAALVAMPAGPQDAVPAAAPVKEKKICRQLDAETGSHFPGKRVCHGAPEWAAIDAANAAGADALSRQAPRGGVPGNP